ncbi:21145_t:CDS:2, partial [Racocetra persica]
HLNYEILKKYKEEVVILIDEFDRFLISCKDAENEIDQITTLAKCINDGGMEGIKSIVFAGSFSITVVLGDRIPQTKQSIRISQNEQANEYFQHPRGVLSSLNSAKTIEASDFTKEQHMLFYRNIQEDRNVHFSEEVVDDIFSITNGYAGLEGLLASLCIEYASNEQILDFNTWNYRFTEFIRNPTRKKINAVNHVEKYLSENDTTQTYNPLIKGARKLLERFLQKGTLQSSEITDEDSIPLLHLRAIGIVKSCDGHLLEFTSNLVLDILSSTYYPFYRDSLARIQSINTPSDFLEKALSLLKYIRHDVIFHSLASNHHSFSEQTIQGELYALLRMAMSYPTYKEYGIECKVNKVSDTEIKSTTDQAIGYTKGREKVCCMFVFNFVPLDNRPENCQFFFPNVVYFEIVYILYSKESKSAKIFRNGRQAKEIPFASN